MAKQSKRSRKFQASGGVAARLKRGTITKHGKLKRRAKPQASAAPNAPTEPETPTRDRSDDLTGKKNLGNLNLDDFFNQLADNLENEEDDSPQADEMEVDQEEESERSSSDEDSHEKPTKKSAENDSPDSSDSSDSDSSDSDAEEDIEAAEERMKEEMARLTEKDPDFHKFLQENEQNLLEFGQSGNASGSEDEEDVKDEKDDDEGKEPKKTEPPSQETILTMSTLDKLRRGAFDSRGIKALKKLVNAYQSGCHLADTSPQQGLRNAFAIESSRVFDSLMVLCLNRCHEAFRWHLLQEDVTQADDHDTSQINDDDDLDPDNKPIPPHKLENCKQWSSVKPILQNFLRATNHLLNESKEPELLSFVLKSLAKYVPFLTPFPSIADLLLKTCTNIWSAPFDATEDFQIVRLQAFFRLRQLAVTQPFPFIETCLKKTYLAYNQRAAFGTASSLTTTLPTLTFLGNCLVELYSLDFQSCYQHAFVYIREMALQLRILVQKNSPEAVQQVYGWQFMHSLKLWVAVLSDAMTKEDKDPDAKLLRSLLYPLAEIILGTSRNAPSPARLLPIRLQCIRLLQQLAASAQIYLPTTSLLLDCFDWKEWYTKPKKATKRNTLRGGLPLYMLIKLPREDPMRTQEQLEAAAVQLFTLLEREMELYRYTAAFPEFCVRIRQRCRDFSKRVRPPRWKAYAKSCIDKCDEYSSFCTLERAKLSMPPKDVAQLECLRPSHVPTMYERHQKAMEVESKSAQSALAAARGATAAPAPSENVAARQDGDEEKESSHAGEGHHDDGNEDEGKGQEKKAKRPKKSRRNKGVEVANAGNVMEEQDKVVEGVDWMDD